MGDIFENLNKRGQHHHAYIVSPDQKEQKEQKTADPKRSKRSKSKTKKLRKPKNIKSLKHTKQNSDYANIERLRLSSEGTQSPNPFGSIRFEPSVIDRFPPLDHADTALISTDTQLQVFCLPTGLFLTKFPSLPIFYTFVWTPETGEHLYGCCLRFFEPVDPQKIYA